MAVGTMSDRTPCDGTRAVVAGAAIDLVMLLTGHWNEMRERVASRVVTKVV